MKIVINSCYGGFGLSKEALDMYCDRKDIKPGNWDHTWNFYSDITSRDIPRDDPELVRVVETLGADANGNYAKLRVVEIPDDVNWYIEEYDGIEHVAERHRTWS